MPLSLRIVIAGFVALLSGGLSTQATAQAAGADLADRYIVEYAPKVRDVSAATERREQAQGFRARFRYEQALKGFAATLTAGQVRVLRADPEVVGVRPVRLVKAVGVVPRLTGETVPSGIRRIEAAGATTAREPSSVNVAVIDTGIDLDHPDLNAAHGRNCVTAEPGAAEDGHGHGTHVAGTIAARNTGAGVLGVAPGTRLFAVKVLDSSGRGGEDQLICGIDWVTSTRKDTDPSNDIAVANMSVGLTDTSSVQGCTGRDPLHKAICAATRAGVLSVAAAGNDSRAFDTATAPDLPAAFPEVLTVTALADSDGLPGALGATSCDGELDDRPASFSNYASTSDGQAHTIAAPGDCIVSTYLAGKHARMSGTSMAAPHVAGSVALCLGEAGASGPCTGLTPAQILYAVRDDARTRLTDDPEFGYLPDPTTPDPRYGPLAWAGLGPDVRAPYVTLEHPADKTVTADTTPALDGAAGIANGDLAEVTVAVHAGSLVSGAPVQTLTAIRTDAGVWSIVLSEPLGNGTYTVQARQADATGNVGTSTARTFTVDVPPATAADTTETADSTTADTADMTSTPVLSPPVAAPEGSTTMPPSPLTALEPAKLEVARSRVVQRGHELDVLAPISQRASGPVEVSFRVASRTTRFHRLIDPSRGELRFRHAIPPVQARLGTGILTFRYRGNARTRGQLVRLRAAPRPALLAPARPRIAGGHLLAEGSVSRRARGVVRIQLDWSHQGDTARHEVAARIRDGRFVLRHRLPADVRDRIAARDGTLHSYVMFTGYGPARMRGELRAFQILPARR